ncbi:acyl carrier protein [Pseudomonas stutzeri]|uniref:acyl carrier protein n=1 Tax=Stutzerimonas stutzeri TaxID=316 RepID=UPI0021099249|nr:acyl carrier protein [Stutzerimonas stutzeri]MCQ4298185.1 acyl carrier protein [Stutzerimonas stutzeri]
MTLVETLQTHISDFICKEADLPVEDIDLQAPLGALGVGSLTGTRLIGNLEEQFGLRLSPTLIFEYPSIAELATAIAEIAAQAACEKPANV